MAIVEIERIKRMKLSEMNTVEMAECLCKIAKPVERIGTNEQVNALLKAYTEEEQKGTTLFAKATRLIGTLTPALLGQECLPYTITILSALTGKSEEEISRQKGIQTMKDIKDCLDEEFIRFFMSSADTAQKM